MYSNCLTGLTLKYNENIRNKKIGVSGPTTNLNTLSTDNLYINVANVIEITHSKNRNDAIALRLIIKTVNANIINVRSATAYKSIIQLSSFGGVGGGTLGGLVLGIIFPIC